MQKNLRFTFQWFRYVSSLFVIFSFLFLMIGWSWDVGSDSEGVVGVGKKVITVFGTVNGSVSHDALIWNGVPYAKPPVGDLRWKAPVDPDPWTHVRSAVAARSACTQGVTDKFWRPGAHFTGSEDCLYLNIYRPNTDTTGLPVFVWIHGGANVIGSAKLYNGVALAKRGNIIVVVIQYRLGMLGWMTHPALRDGGTTDDQSGNYGTLDQMKALAWVENNIAAFGGDPNKVTVGGQSAGGQAVMNLIITPKTDVLFQQAFAESPALGQLMPLTATATGDTQANEVIDWLLVDDGTVANLTDAATHRGSMSNTQIQTYLRGKKVKKILQAAIGGPGAATGQMPVPSPFMDGNVIPTTSWWETIHAGNFKKVPLIIGTTKYEYKDLMTLYGSLMKLYAATPSGKYSWDDLYGVLNGKHTFDQVLPAARDKVAYEQSGLLKSREWQAECNAIARAIKVNSAANTVYSYLFTWAGGGDPKLTNFQKIFGASHAQDVPFFFGNEKDLFGYSFTKANKVGRVALQGAMMDYLLAFVKTGDPNPAGSTLLNWTQWNNAADKYITFDADLNNYILAMSATEATSTIVNGEVTTVVATDSSYYGWLFTLLGIYPYSVPY